MAAGIGAIFPAPLGGAVLGAELLYRDDVESDALAGVNASGAGSAETALAWLRALSSTWSEADVPEAGHATR